VQVEHQVPVSQNIPHNNVLSENSSFSIQHTLKQEQILSESNLMTLVDQGFKEQGNQVALESLKSSSTIVSPLGFNQDNTTHQNEKSSQNLAVSIVIQNTNNTNFRES
jgi:hypothetical protein